MLRAEGEPAVIELQTGQWSDWLRVKFKLGFLQTVRGMVRFYLARTEPFFELYASPINFDPDAPLFAISSPPTMPPNCGRSWARFIPLECPKITTAFAIAPTIRITD